MKSNNYLRVIFYFALFWRKRGFSTPTHTLVSDYKVTELLVGVVSPWRGAGIAERWCYTPVEVAPLRDSQRQE